MKSRNITLPIVLAALCLTGCEQRQDEALNLYKQIQREAQQRDEAVKKQMDVIQSDLKTIGETLAEMQKQTGQGTAAAPSTDKIAEAVSEQVAKKVGEQNAAAFASMKAQIDELKAIAATRPVAAPAPAPAPVAVAPAQPAPRYNPPVTRPVDMTDPGKPRSSSDPTRKTFKIDFGDGR